MELLTLRSNFIKIVRASENFRLSLFIAACIVLGGTSQNILNYKVILYIVSFILIGHTLTTWRIEKRNVISWPVLLGAGFLGLHLLYLVPLPSQIWTNIAGRELAVKGFELTQSTLPWMPLSLTPEKSLISLFAFLPPIAIVLIFISNPSKHEINYAFRTIVIMAVLSTMLSLAQVISNSNSLYFYKITNMGSGVGFFSNANHQASFLAMVLTISIGLSFPSLVSNSNKNRRLHSKSVFWVLSSIMIVLGIFLTYSTFGYLLLICLLILISIVIVIKPRTVKLILIPLTLISILIFVGLLFSSNIIKELYLELSSNHDLSRHVIFENTLQLQKQFGIWGGGPGAFYDLYKVQENRATMSTIFIPQAHNDFLQITLEYGVFGLTFFILFIYKFVSRGLKIFRQKTSLNQMYLFSIIALSLPVLHSVIDYPLRNLSTLSLSAFLFSYSCRRL